MSHLLNSLSCLLASEKNQEMLIVVGAFTIGAAFNIGYFLL